MVFKRGWLLVLMCSPVCSTFLLIVGPGWLQLTRNQVLTPPANAYTKRMLECLGQAVFPGVLVLNISLGWRSPVCGTLIHRDRRSINPSSDLVLSGSGPRQTDPAQKISYDFTDGVSGVDGRLSRSFPVPGRRGRSGCVPEFFSRQRNR